MWVGDLPLPRPPQLMRRIGGNLMDDEGVNDGSDPAAADNMGADGTYLVGKNKPPKSGQFCVGDGRKRGRRPKGTRNLATDLREELAERVNVTIGGKTRGVSNQQAILKVAVILAKKGNPKYTDMILKLQQAIVEPQLVLDAEKATVAPDFSGLTIDEMRVLEYLILKGAGEPIPARVPTIIVKPYGWRDHSENVNEAEIEKSDNFVDE
jgi:hypothetical protein